MFYTVPVLTFESVDEILTCGYSNVCDLDNIVFPSLGQMTSHITSCLLSSLSSSSMDATRPMKLLRLNLHLAREPFFVKHLLYWSTDRDI